MVIIGVYQSLSNNAFYIHRCLENIKKLYKLAGKCDYKHHYKANIEDATVSTREGFSENSPMSSGPSGPVRKHNVRK